MINAIVVDDEERSRSVLTTQLSQYCPQIQVVGEACDVPSAVIAINKLQPDVVFLDVEMPNYSGFELLDFFKEIEFEIVFVTAYSDYAIRAFEVSAIDYLLKPVRIDKLEQAAEKIEQRILGNQQSKRYETLKSNLGQADLNKIAVPVADGLVFLSLSEIICMEADGSYSRLHLKTGEHLVISKRLKYFEDCLQNNPVFFRVHRSFMVNISAIAKYNKAESYLDLENGVSVPIARDKKAEFERAVGHLKV